MLRHFFLRLRSKRKSSASIRRRHRVLGRSASLEALEEKFLLAYGFLRTDGYVATSTEAAATIGRDTPVDDFREQWTWTNGTVLGHSDAGAALMAGNSPAAIADSMATATAICPTPIDVNTSIPTVNVAASYIDAALGGRLVEGELSWYLQADAENFGEYNGAVSTGTFSFHHDDDVQYALTGVLFVGANGGKGTTGTGSAGEAVNVFSQIYGYGFDAWVNADSNGDGTWYITGDIPGIGAFSIPDAGALNNYFYFPVLANPMTLYSSTNAQVWASADGPGNTAQAQWHPLADAWVFATPANQGLSPGDFNADGLVNVDDYKIWQENQGLTFGGSFANGDADQDGDVDNDDFEIWRQNATDVVVVSNPNDELDTDYSFGDLSLREALAIAGSDPIVFDPSISNITLTYDGPDAGSTPDQLTASGANIIGPGADLLTISGNGLTRVLSATDTTIEGVTITGGNATSGGYGGGIFGQNLVVQNSSITGNTATGAGGGICSLGSLQLIHSEVSDNHAGGSGGGLYITSNLSGYDIEISDSTISGNEAGTGVYGVGGGICSYLFDNLGPGTNFTITNSTISGNSAHNGGGGISSSYYSPYGAGFSSSPKINNTIIAMNTDFSSNARDVEGAFYASSSHNLIGYDPYGLFASGSGNLRGTSTVLDPHLAPLDFYGGRTRTQALLSNSAAIDAGDNDFVGDDEWSFDQRGRYYDRIVDWDGDSNATVDIGAMELAVIELYT